MALAQKRCRLSRLSASASTPFRRKIGFKPLPPLQPDKQSLAEQDADELLCFRASYAARRQSQALHLLPPQSSFDEAIAKATVKGAAKFNPILASQTVLFRSDGACLACPICLSAACALDCPGHDTTLQLQATYDWLLAVKRGGGTVSLSRPVPEMEADLAALRSALAASGNLSTVFTAELATARAPLLQPAHRSLTPHATQAVVQPTFQAALASLKDKAWSKVIPVSIRKLFKSEVEWRRALTRAGRLEFGELLTSDVHSLLVVLPDECLAVLNDPLHALRIALLDSPELERCAPRAPRPSRPPLSVRRTTCGS